MANRVVIDGNRLSVSMPGRDVLTAGYGDMIFDTRLGEMSGVIMTGSYNASQGGVKTIPLGRTYAKAPVVWAAGYMNSVYPNLFWHMMGGRKGSSTSYSGIWAAADRNNLYIESYGFEIVKYVVFNVGAA